MPELGIAVLAAFVVIFLAVGLYFEDLPGRYEREQNNGGCP